MNNVKNEMEMNTEDIKKKYPTVFTQKLGLFKHDRFQSELKKNVFPVFIKPRQLPYAMIDKVEQEIQRLVDEKIIQPMKSISSNG